MRLEVYLRRQLRCEKSRCLAMVRIVILGEQTETLGMLADALRQGGYQVRAVSTFKWKMSVLKYLSPHFVIVVAENPHFAAAKVCSKMRRDHSLVRVRI